jgi:hypothetical protein
MLARQDDKSAEKLRAEYLAYTAAEIDYYTGLHKHVFGRPIPNVMLLHLNRLSADLMNQLLDIFEANHYRFVSLDRARSDAAYDTPDTLTTSYGPMWGDRSGQSTRCQSRWKPGVRASGVDRAVRHRCKKNWAFSPRHGDE